MSKLIPLFIGLLLLSCAPSNESTPNVLDNSKKPSLTLDQAEELAALAFKCIQTEYPNKLGQVLGGDNDLGSPKALHPAFYGCFDWHSAVHGHWMLTYLVKKFPDQPNGSEIIKRLQENITKENIAGELNYFKRKTEKSYERTYGWAWLLKLQEELDSWDHPAGKTMAEALQPLTDLIVDRYIEFLPKLVYPIRVGEHTNTAFGMSFAYDYAKAAGKTKLLETITQRTLDYYNSDAACPLSWEPSGFDFLSPCLEEADMMRRVLEPAAFKKWFDAFLPTMADANASLEVAKVSDRTDGKLVHLDGLNFSRAWCFYGIAKSDPAYAHLSTLADIHLADALSNITDGNYSGEHWLASFATYALSQQ